MTNKVYVSVVFRAMVTKNLQSYIKSEIVFKQPRKDDEKKTCELVLKDTKKISDNQFTYLALEYGNLKEFENYGEIKFENVQARLYKGENYYGKYSYIKVFLDEHIIFTHFLEKDELLIINKFMKLEAEFSEDRKELVQFERATAI